MNKVLPKLNGIAAILAQAPAVSAAFGRSMGFILMMAAFGIVLLLGALTILVASEGALHFLAGWK